MLYVGPTSSASGARPCLLKTLNDPIQKNDVKLWFPWLRKDDQRRGTKTDANKHSRQFDNNVSIVLYFHCIP